MAPREFTSAFLAGSGQLCGRSRGSYLVVYKQGPALVRHCEQHAVAGWQPCDACASRLVIGPLSANLHRGVSLDLCVWPLQMGLEVGQEDCSSAHGAVMSRAHCSESKMASAHAHVCRWAQGNQM